MFKNFFCGMCKKQMPLDMKTTMILIDNSEDVKYGSICTGCNFSLKDIFNSRQLQTKQITLLDKLGVKT